VTTIDLDAPPRYKLRTPRGQADLEAQEEGYISLGRSAARHWTILVVSFLVGLLFGIGAGAIVSPKYTAKAELIVGKSLNLTNTAAISGFPSAEAQLAQDYARLVGTPAYESALQTHLGRLVHGTTSATEVPQSPVIEVYGYGHSQADAMVLANAASAALIDTINAVNQQTSSANQSLLSQYQAQSLVLEQDQQKAAALQAQLAGASGSYRDSLEQQAAQASATVDVDRFKLNALGNEYSAEFNPNMSIQEAVTPLGGAASEGGNRPTHIELGGIAGLVCGVLLGLAIAAVMDVTADRRARRSFHL
jgi:capsular polysaccharide biosynthesis protein